MSFISEEEKEFEWGDQFRHAWVSINAVIYTVLCPLLFARWLAMAFVDIK